MSRTLLIDGDILIYRTAHQHQKATRWDEDTWSYHGDLAGARRTISLWLMNLQERLDADESRIFISDSKFNWRHAVVPSYKGNRAAWAQYVFGSDALILPKPGPQRPVLHKPLRELLLSDHGAIMAPTLEADDLMGIHSTDPSGGERVIVSPDKDMRTIPGLLFNPDVPRAGIARITPDMAAWWHMYQTLTGDATDGYGGCKGVGDVKARALLPAPESWDARAAWAVVLAAYAKAGMEDEDALNTARIARVLHHGEYDQATNQVSLWEPPK